MHQPLVSIIIPTFNRVKHLGETLNSVINQKYDYWECLFVDDGSTDNTRELISSYQEKDKRIKYFERPKNYIKGANSCRNFGFSQSKGEYIQWLDSDDLISPDKIKGQIKIFQDKRPDIVTCKWGKFDDPNIPLINAELEVYRDFDSSLEFFNALAKSYNYFPIHAYLISRIISEKAGPWLEDLSVNQDGEYISRVVANSTKICFSVVGTALYRNGEIPKTRYSTRSKKNELISTWKLIETFLQSKYPGETLDFIKVAKSNIFDALKGDLVIMKNHREFFKEELKKESIKKKLNRWFKYFKNIIGF